MKDYVDKITELETECEKLKNLEENFKLNEKKLINDMKKKGDLARQMLSEKDTYISQLLSNNDSGSGSGNGDGNNNINTSHNSHNIGGGKSSSSSSGSSSGSSSSSSSGSGGAGGVGHGKTESSNLIDNNTTSTSSSSGAPSSSNSNMKQSYLDQSNPAPSTPSNKSSSNPSISTPNTQHQSYNQGREESREEGVGQRNNRSVTLSMTDQDQQAYLKQAFCGFVKAKEAVEMEHLGRYE